MSTTATTPLPTGRWTIDPVHSSASFRVKHLGTTNFKAGFGEIEGVVDGDAGRIEGAVKVESIDISQADLRGHVLADDFFAAETHPDVRFVSTSVEAGDDGKLVVKGDLTIKGITKSVTAEGVLGEEGIGFDGVARHSLELSTTVDRRDFDLNWQAELPGGKEALAWDVTLDVTLELTAVEA
jgi:polyisoprenoid-binding protein YceI